jgi:hypothetical protein
MLLETFALIVGLTVAAKVTAGCLVKKWTSDDLRRRQMTYEMS